MKALSREVVFRFAEEYALRRKGFALAQITPYFEQYQHGVASPLQRGMAVRKSDHFVDCVLSLTPRNQRYALYDLCDRPPDTKGPLPDAVTRRSLLRLLVQADGLSPLGVELSAATTTGVRDDWFVAASRLTISPAAAVTAARTLVEATCKTILTELGIAADESGDLPRLFTQTRRALGIDVAAGAGQSVGQVVSGLTTLVQGLASLSNSAGDRHGLASGAELDDHTLAAAAVHAAGSVSLFLVQIYRDIKRAGWKKP